LRIRPKLLLLLLLPLTAFPPFTIRLIKILIIIHNANLLHQVVRHVGVLGIQILDDGWLVLPFRGLHQYIWEELLRQIHKLCLLRSALGDIWLILWLFTCCLRLLLLLLLFLRKNLLDIKRSLVIYSEALIINGKTIIIVNCICTSGHIGLNMFSSGGCVAGRSRKYELFRGFNCGVLSFIWWIKKLGRIEIIVLDLACILLE
jgi:hypothetical protein